MVKKALSAALLLFVFLFISAVRADILIYPSTTNISCYVNQEYPLNITISNNNDFKIYNISIEPNTMATFDMINELNSHENKSSFLRIKPASSYNGSYNFTFYFYFLQNVTMNTSTVEVNMTNTAFVPSQVTITQGSTIIWTNQDNLTHKVKDRGGEFASPDLSQGSSYQYTFDTFKNYTIEDDYIKYYMYVNVTPRVQEVLVRNRDYDKNLTLNISCNYLPTTLNASLLVENITMNFNETAEIVISIINTGNQTAKNIKFDANWMTFSKNNFDLDPNVLTYVIASIKPSIDFENQTNTTHAITINITSLNAPSIEKTVNIFINYASQSDIDRYKQTIPPGGNPLECPSGFYQLRGGMLYCVNSTIEYIYLNTTNPVFWMNISEEEKTNLWSTLGYLKSGFNDLASRLNEMQGNISNLSGFSQENRDMLNNLFESQQKDRETINIFLVILGILAFLVVAGVVMYKIYERKKYKESQLF